MSAAVGEVNKVRRLSDVTDFVSVTSVHGFERTNKTYNK